MIDFFQQRHVVHGIAVERFPVFTQPDSTPQDVEKVIVPNIQETLGYVMDAIKLTKEMLHDEVPFDWFRWFALDNLLLCS